MYRVFLLPNPGRVPLGPGQLWQFHALNQRPQVNRRRLRPKLLCLQHARPRLPQNSGATRPRGPSQSGQSEEKGTERARNFAWNCDADYKEGARVREWCTCRWCGSWLVTWGGCFRLGNWWVEGWRNAERVSQRFTVDADRQRDRA